jgi:hypothetical protein
MGSVTLSFVVPTNATGGNHTIVFVGAGFQCDPTNGTGLPVGVLDLEISRGATTTVAGTGGGSLARTGIEIALYLAVALALLVVGFLLVQEARRRRRRAARRRNAPEHLVDR